MRFIRCQVVHHASAPEAVVVFALLDVVAQGREREVRYETRQPSTQSAGVQPLNACWMPCRFALARECCLKRCR